MTLTATQPTVDVVAVFGRVSVTPGVIDDQARLAYLNGQCVGLALAIIDHVPGASAYLLSEQEVDYGDDDDCADYGSPWDTWSHLIALLPDERVVDITGVYANIDAYLAAHQQDDVATVPWWQDDADLEYIRAAVDGDGYIEGLRPQNLAVAATFVAPLLASATTRAA